MPAQDTQMITGLQTANGQSAGVPLATATMALVSIIINAVPGGTNPELHAWLQYSPDAGVTYFDVGCDQHVFQEDLDEPTAEPTEKVRNITPKTTGLDANGEQCTGLFRHIPGGLYRLKWRIAGTDTPDSDFTARISTK